MQSPRANNSLGFEAQLAASVPEGRVVLLAPATSYRIADFLNAARALDVGVTVGSNHRQTLEALSCGGTMTVDLTNYERGVAQIGPREVRAFEIRSVENGPAQVNTHEVGLPQILADVRGV